ncbi:ATP-binding protein [Streptomyces netropsis]
MPSGPLSARLARRLARWVMADYWGLGECLADTVCLLVSEIAGNAVRHTGARAVGLRMSQCSSWIGVRVRDPSRALPCLLPTRGMDISGRGMFLVDNLADRWGADIEPCGKTVWFHCALPSGGGGGNRSGALPMPTGG